VDDLNDTNNSGPSGKVTNQLSEDQGNEEYAKLEPTLRESIDEACRYIEKLKEEQGRLRQEE